MSNINSTVAAAQYDENIFAALVQESKNYILSCAFKAAGRFVSESDDEWSVALIAFHEAVKTFNESRGNFYSFASMVIRRRLIDFLRSEQRHAPEISVSHDVIEGNTDEGSEEAALALQVKERVAELSEDSMRQSENDKGNVKEEIEAISGLLVSYGFSFFDLADCSPRSQKTKAACAKAVAALLSDAILLQKMRSKKTLPIKEIQEISKVPRKVLERHRKYIIAAAEILNGEYPLLAEYMSYIRKAMCT